MPFIGFGEKAIYAKSPNDFAPNYRIKSRQITEFINVGSLKRHGKSVRHLAEVWVSRRLLCSLCFDEFQFSEVKAGTDKQLNEFIANFKRKYKKENG